MPEVSERTFRAWVKEGLRHARLPTGTILVKYTHIDEFLSRLVVEENEVDAIVDEMIESLKKKRAGEKVRQVRKG
jgi:hypothetical protein